MAVRFFSRSAVAFILTFSLVACSGGELQLGAEKKKDPNSVELGPDGLPSIEDLMKPGPLGEKTLGRVDALVTVIEYMSLTCPHCKAFHAKTYPRFKKAFIDTGKVRYIVREFPIGRSAGNAAIVTRCGKKDRYFKLVDLFLTNQHKWVSQEVRLDAIYNVAKKSGLSKQEFDHCMQDKVLLEGLDWVKKRGRLLGVSGTPTFFVNGQKVRKPLSFEELSALISPHLS